MGHTLRLKETNERQINICKNIISNKLKITNQFILINFVKSRTKSAL